MLRATAKPFNMAAAEFSDLPKIISGPFNLYCCWESHNSIDTVQITPPKKNSDVFYVIKCASCHQRGHAGSKTLLRLNSPVLNWRCHLTQVDPYNGHRTVVCVLRIELLATIHSCNFASPPPPAFLTAILQINLGYLAPPFFCPLVSVPVSKNDLFLCRVDVEP